MPAPIRRVDELGFPIPGSFDDLPNSAERSKRTAGRFIYRYRWALLLLLVPLFFGEPIVNGVRSYVADQLITRAAIDCHRERFPAALAAANRALFWAPENSDRWEMFEIRADIRSKMQDLHGCLDDLNELIRLLENPKLSHRFSNHLRDAYGMRGWVLERIGQHKLAIADSTTALNLCADEPNRAKYLNSRAYIRALANLELPQALEDANQSLNIVRSDPLVVDTRAYVLFKLGKLDEAKKEMDEAIGTMTHGDRDEAADAADGPHIWSEEDELRERQRYEDYRDSLAVMYHHRGEILKKLGQDTAGDEDIRKAEFFGYSPERGVY